jgi:hypothetical protein
MSVHHSEETYDNLVARLPQATGRDVKEWCQLVEDGPAFTRQDEKVHWLQDEYGIAHSYAKAIIHECDRVRAARRVS